MLKGVVLERRMKTSLLYFGLAVMLSIIIFPIFWSFLTSIRLPKDVYDTGWPTSVTLSNYWGVLTHRQYFFFTYLTNSFIISLTTTILVVLVGAPCAYVLARFRGISKIILVLFLVIVILRAFPGLCNLVPYFLLMQKLHLIDTKIGMILTYTSGNLPLMLFLMTIYYSGVPKELEEAALIDGCSPRQALFRVVLPMAKPGIAVVTIFTFVNAWKEFLYATILTKSVSTRTLPVAIQMFASQYDVAWHYMTAAGILTMIPAIIPAFYLQKHIVRGVTFGAIKG